MAAKTGLEAQLRRLSQLRRADVSSLDSGVVEEVRAFLGSRNARVVAAAAEVAAIHSMDANVPSLVAAFDRLMEDPIRRDSGCVGKAAIANALHDLGAYEADLYLRGVEYRQLERVRRGRRRDTAMEVRTACSRGLVRIGHPDTLLLLGCLLADPEPIVRLRAAQSVAYHGSDLGLPLLRLKALSGDSEPNITAECLSALMRISPESSAGFVAGFLDAEDDVTAESAAFALGESHAEQALAPLTGWRKRADERGMGRVALMAIAMLRIEPAFEALCQVIASEPGPVARQAISAFEFLRGDDSIRRRVEAAAERNPVDLSDAIEGIFGPG